PWQSSWKIRVGPPAELARKFVDHAPGNGQRCRQPGHRPARLPLDQFAQREQIVVTAPNRWRGSVHSALSSLFRRFPERRKFFLPSAIGVVSTPARAHVLLRRSLGSSSITQRAPST